MFRFSRSSCASRPRPRRRIGPSSRRLLPSRRAPSREPGHPPRAGRHRSRGGLVGTGRRRRTHAGAAARGPRLRRPLARHPGGPRRDDRLRRVRLLAPGLRPIRPGRPPASALVHARRSPPPAGRARRRRGSPRRADRPLRRRLHRRHMRGQRVRHPHPRPVLLAPHFFVEDEAITGIQAARAAYEGASCGTCSRPITATSTTRSGAGTAPGSTRNSGPGASTSTSRTSASRSC